MKPIDCSVVTNIMVSLLTLPDIYCVPDLPEWFLNHHLSHPCVHRRQGFPGTEDGPCGQAVALHWVAGLSCLQALGQKPRSKAANVPCQPQPAPSVPWSGRSPSPPSSPVQELTSDPTRLVHPLGSCVFALCALSRDTASLCVGGGASPSLLPPPSGSAPGFHCSGAPARLPRAL